MKLPESLVQIDHPNVMIEAIKKAEDSGHLILRLYETAGAVAKVRLSLSLDCQTIEETDLLENATELLVERKNEASLCFTPFEIKTIRIKLA